MGSWQEFGLYPAAIGELSAERGRGLREDLCGWALENEEDLHGLPGMQRWQKIWEAGWVGPGGQWAEGWVGNQEEFQSPSLHTGPDGGAV